MRAGPKPSPAFGNRWVAFRNSAIKWVSRPIRRDMNFTGINSAWTPACSRAFQACSSGEVAVFVGELFFSVGSLEGNFVAAGVTLREDFPSLHFHNLREPMRLV